MTTNEQLALAEPADQLPVQRDERQYLELWFALARLSWRSLVLVPGHPGGSAAEAARALAEVGQKVGGQPIHAVTMGSLDYGTALALSDLQEQIRRVATERSVPPEAIEVYPHQDGHADQPSRPETIRGADFEIRTGDGADPEQPPPSSEGFLGSGVLTPTVARFVISIPCLLSEPLGLAATRAADAVVIVIELGRTRMADVRRIVEQVGRPRVAGTILLR